MIETEVETLWLRVDEIHALVNRITAEEARLRSAGQSPARDLLPMKEKLIEESDRLLAQLADLYARR